MLRRVDVFFYGLFMDAAALHAKGFDPADLRQASVRGMALRLGERATLVPAAEESVHGMLMALSHAELDRLYADASVSAYRAEPVLAHLTDGSAVPALCFNLPTPPQPHETNPGIRGQIAGGGAAAGVAGKLCRAHLLSAGTTPLRQVSNTWLKVSKATCEWSAARL